jgi:hypothetical protein
MSTFNQSPEGQATQVILVSSPSITEITASSDLETVGGYLSFAAGTSGSVTISFGGGGQPSGPTIPTTGQIWPPGVLLGDSTEPAKTSSFGWVWWD